MVTRDLRRWRDRGAAAVEFALVVPVLILLIFGAIEFGLYVQSLTMTENAAREGVRLASLIGSRGDITSAEVTKQVKDAAVNALGPVGLTNQTVVVTCIKSDGTSCNNTIGAKDSAGGMVTVTVTATFTGVTGMVNGTCSKSWWMPCVPSELKAYSYMRIE